MREKEIEKGERGWRGERDREKDKSPSQGSRPCPIALLYGLLSEEVPAKGSSMG